MEYLTRGQHFKVDLWGIEPDILDDPDRLEKEMVRAVEVAGATMLSSQKKKFEPQGATVLLLLSESHMSIHTYPEKGFAALDCYTCGDHVNPLEAMEVMAELLQPTYKQITYTERGVRWDGREGN